MPKNRNRTATNNFEFSNEFLRALPYPEKVNVNGKKNSDITPTNSYFGELVSNKNDQNHVNQNYNSLRVKYASSSSSDNVASGISDLEIISFGKSSSSSISWNEEFDNEATQRVQNEFERMERVLQGIESIPSNYNKDEYEQWIQTFPQLSVIGSNLKNTVVHHDQPSNTASNKYEEIISIDSDLGYLMANCDNSPTSNELNKLNSVKSTVIEQVFEKISSKLLNEKPSHKIADKKTISNRNKKITDRNHLIPSNAQNLDKDFDSFLRVSPAMLNPSNYLNARQQSSHSIARSEKLASKWMHEEPVEYSSLPYVSPGAKSKFHKSIKRNSYRKVSASKTNHVSLPPIKTSSLSSANQYRSISATPRQPHKGTSALSVQVDSLTDKQRPRFEVTNYLVQNDLEPRSNLLKRSKHM